MTLVPPTESDSFNEAGLSNERKLVIKYKLINRLDLINE